MKWVKVSRSTWKQEASPCAHPGGRYLLRRVTLFFFFFN